jgi:hypothetical protein
MSLEGQPWTTWSVSTTRYDTSWVLDGWSYEFMIRTNNGNDAYDTITDWSAGITAVCHPLTPGPPTGIVTIPTATGFDISWDADASDITEWAVLFFGM